jgi:nucleoporin GLE1
VAPVQAPQPTSHKPVSHLVPGAEKYAQIHQSLKKLRKWINDAGNQNKEFKKKVGEMRRTLRMTVGQLTSGAGTNGVQVS